MPKPIDHLDVGRARIVRVLRSHGIAPMRTLEQKISDAGPNNLRVDPHVLTTAKNQLLEEGLIRSHGGQGGTPWFYYKDTPAAAWRQRLSELQPIYLDFQKADISKRMGQTLEIAIYRALKAQSHFEFLGGFPDLDDHDDSTLYRKVEPPTSMSGRVSQHGPLDFVLVGGGGTAGIEAKNIREWLYPNKADVKQMLRKCCELDLVPVIIARRIHYVTMKDLRPCGVLVHETYNQLLPAADQALAKVAKHKTKLGYHDIRTGNQPDTRLSHFIEDLLPNLLLEARERFDAHKDELHRFATGQLELENLARPLNK